MASDTKTALLNSAEHAVRNRGFDAFSYADLAQEVGIRKASIHHHFPTKAKLSVALMERYHAEFEQICTDIDENQPAGAGRLRALIERYRDALSDGETLCLCVAMSLSCESLSPEAINQLNRFRNMVTVWLEHVFERGQQDGTIAGVTAPKQEAVAMLAQLEGAQLAARAARDIAVFDAALELLSSRLH